MKDVTRNMRQNIKIKGFFVSCFEWTGRPFVFKLPLIILKIYYLQKNYQLFMSSLYTASSML